jgi:hypothetical protein
MAKSFNDRMKERFAKITNDYQQVNEYVHETAVMILEHAAQHNDCEMAQHLVMAMPASIRREALITWFAEFSPIVVKNDSDWTAKAWKATDKKYVEYDLEAAKAFPFYKIAERDKEAKQHVPMNLSALLKLIESTTKKLEKELDGATVEDDVRPSAELVLAQLKAIKVLPASNDAPAQGVQDAPQKEAA